MSTLLPPMTNIMFTVPPAMTSLISNDDKFMFDNMGQDDHLLPLYLDKKNDTITTTSTTTTTTTGNIH